MDSLENHDVEVHYDLLDPVGQGGMGTVYQARHKESGELFAIKVLSKELSRTRVQRERFFREAKTAQGLSHLNIVSVREVAYLNGLPCIVMEFLEGETLYDQYKKGLSLATGISRLLQVVDALLYAHEQGVTHRDLKPANIMVSPEGVVKVADWGLAKTATDETGLTKTGLLVGTPTYMAPEQVVGEPIGAATDLYALGVMLYELCAKTAPFVGTLAQILTAKLKEIAPSLNATERALPAGLAGLVNDLLRRDPSKRPSTSEVRRRLTIVLDRLTSKSAREIKPTLPSKAPKETRPSIAPYAVKLENHGFPLRSIFLSALFTLLLGCFLGFSFSKSKPAAKGKLILPLASSVHLDDFNVVKLVLSRQPMPGYVDYEIQTFDGESSLNLKGRFELTAKSQKHLSINLPSPVFESIRVKLETKEKSNSGTLKYGQVFVPSSNELLDKLFEPIDALRGERLSRLVKDCQDLGAQMMRLREEGVPVEKRLSIINEGLRTRMDREGFSADYCDKLRALIEKILKKPPLLGTKLAKRLMPLRHIERALMNYVCPELPWGKCATKGLGFTYGTLELPDRFPGWHLVATHSFIEHFDNGQFLWLWMCDWAKARQYKVKPALAEITWHPIKEVIDSMHFLEAKEKRPMPHHLTVSKTVHFLVNIPKGMAWPPQGAMLGLTTRLFGPEALISLRINDSPLLMVTNAANFALPYAQTFSTTQKSWTCVPLSPNWLNRGMNRIYIEPLQAPGPQIPVPICLKEIKIFVR